MKQILVLGNETISRLVQGFVPSNSGHSVTVEEDFNPIPQNSLGADMYRPTSNHMDEIEKMVKSKDFDMIIVAHNQGYGIARANTLPSELRKRVVVVISSDSHDERKYYRALHIDVFTDSSGLGEIIDQTLNMKSTIA